MKVHPLAVALISAAACMSVPSAFAGAATSLSDDDSTVVFGSARLSNLQDIGDSAKVGASSASVGADALRSVSGNVGINLAAGALNAQTNQIALITTPQAEVISQQNVHAIAQSSGSATVQLGARAVGGASGNIGVNLAGGVANAQFNGLVVH